MKILEAIFIWLMLLDLACLFIMFNIHIVSMILELARK